MECNQENCEEIRELYNLSRFDVLRKEISENGIDGIYRAAFIKGIMPNSFFNYLFKSRTQLSNEDKAKISNILNLTGDDNKVLVIEANRGHGECIPGYVKYLLELGYKVEVLVLEAVYKEKPLAGINDNSAQIHGVSLRVMQEILKHRKCQFFKKIVFISSRVLIKKYSISMRVDKLFNCINKYAEKVIMLEHAIEETIGEPKVKYRITVLAKTQLDVNKDIHMAYVNSNYFVEDYNHVKGEGDERITFAMVGYIGDKKEVLLESFKYLDEKGYSSYKIVVAGRDIELNLEDKYKDKIEFLGWLTYEEMYEVLKKVDFYLPLLDINNEGHKKFLKERTSGGFQLIYGFEIPALIEKSFGESHELNTSNSIIYDDNDIGKAMERAIAMSGEEYQKLRENLRITKEKIREESLSNLKSIM